MPSVILLIAILFASASRADILVDVPGCYYFQGELTELHADRLRLKVFGGAGAEEEIQVWLRGPARRLLLHGQLELVANVQSVGLLGAAKITAEGHSLSPLAAHAFNPKKVGEWRGYPQAGSCQ